MAKELPYFKFDVSEWLTGDIVFEPMNVQGLFINICAIYWKKVGELSIDDLTKRYPNESENIQNLANRFFSVNNGLIEIHFLNEQLQSKQVQSHVNSINGKKGGRPKTAKTQGEKPNRLNPKSELKPKESNIEEEVEVKEDKEEDIVQIKNLPLALDERLVKFQNQLKPFIPEYGKEMIRQFYNYWTERTEGAKKMRYEKEKAFDIARRLGNWKRNESKFNTNNGKSIIEQNRETTQRVIEKLRGQ